MPDNTFALAINDILVNRAPEFVGIFDATQNRFAQVNPAGVELLGYSSEQELLAEPARILLTPNFSEAEWSALLVKSRQSRRQEA
jgi:PAS domain-containing protein